MTFQSARTFFPQGGFARKPAKTLAAGMATPTPQLSVSTKSQPVKNTMNNALSNNKSHSSRQHTMPRTARQRHGVRRQSAAATALSNAPGSAASISRFEPKSGVALHLPPHSKTWRPDQAPTNGEASSPGGSNRPRRILVVDDDQDSRDLENLVLTRAGYVVDAAAVRRVFPTNIV